MAVICKGIQHNHVNQRWRFNFLDAINKIIRHLKSTLGELSSIPRENQNVLSHKLCWELRQWGVAVVSSYRTGPLPRLHAGMHSRNRQCRLTNLSASQCLQGLYSTRRVPLHVQECLFSSVWASIDSLIILTPYMHFLSHRECHDSQDTNFIAPVVTQ